MDRMSLAGLAVLLASHTAQAQDHGAEAVAAAILTGFVQQDATMIAPHSNATNLDFFEGIAEGSQSVSDLFEGTRGSAGRSWDGMILPARYDGAATAVVPFAIETGNGPAPLNSGAAGRYMVVTLTLDGPEDTTWGFEDINYLDRSAYEARGQTRP